MDTQPAFGFEDLVTTAVTDMAQVVSERAGESQEQQFARCQAAVHMIMGFQPRDVIEVMLAGHCVMLHEVMTADVHTSLCSDTRRPIVALKKAFNDNLDRLERCRQRPAEGRHDIPQVPPVADQLPESAEPAVKPVAATMNRAARRQAAKAQMRAVATASRAASRQSGPVPPGATRSGSTQTAPQPDGVVISPPMREAIGKCQANPEAMTALAAGDPVRFARALGIDQPGEAFLAAAKSPNSPFDPQSNGPWPVDRLAGTRKA